jgi:hypothetical protein
VFLHILASALIDGNLGEKWCVLSAGGNVLDEIASRFVIQVEIPIDAHSQSASDLLYFSKHPKNNRKISFKT